MQMSGSHRTGVLTIITVMVAAWFFFPSPRFYSAYAIGSEPYQVQSPATLPYSDFPKTPLGLQLIATLKRSGHATAMIKSTATGRLRPFTTGDKIDFAGINEDVTIVQISNCALVLKRGDNYESLSCKLRINSSPFTVGNVPLARMRSPLARFKIIDDAYENKPLFKSNYDREIKAISTKHRVDPYLVKAIIKAESNFNPRAVSTKNAMGIMQLAPATARDYGIKNPFDPVENIDGGVRVLRDLMNYFYGNRRLAIAAYNAGKWAVIKHGFQVPPYEETMDFVQRVMMVDFDR